MKANNIKKFWVVVLAVITIAYVYYYIYREQEGFVVPGTETLNSVKRGLREKMEDLNDKYGPETIELAIKKSQYNSEN
jgi:hypothetical protein